MPAKRTKPKRASTTRKAAKSKTVNRPSARLTVPAETDMNEAQRTLLQTIRSGPRGPSLAAANHPLGSARAVAQAARAFRGLAPCT